MNHSPEPRKANTSHRYPGYDYGDPGGYVFTVVVANRACLLGTIRDKAWSASPLGEVVRDCWLRLPVRFPTILLDAFAVMPNHIHGIVLLGANPDVELDDSLPATTSPPESEIPADTNWAEARQHRRPRLIPPSRERLRPALGEVVRSLKASSTTRIRKEFDANFAWQPNYWDRIIRNDVEMERFRSYIENNPARWEEDKEYLPGAW